MNIPDSITSIGDCAFYSCSSLVSIDIPDSVTSIGEYAFKSCTSLVSVNIPESVTSIERDTFRDCLNLTKIVIPGAVKSIYDTPFEGCENLYEVIFEDSDSDIILHATNRNYGFFKGCSQREVYLGRNLLKYEGQPYNLQPRDSTFYYNNNIEIFSIGQFVDRCSSLVFDKCENLQILNCYSITPPIIEKPTTYQYTNLVVNIPQGTLSTYQENNTWKGFWNLNETLPSPYILAEQVFLNIEDAEITIGESVQLEATVMPEDTTDKTIIWTSSDEKVVSVSENGLVTAVSEGFTIITATCGEVSATCVITVSAPIIEAEKIVLNLESAELNIGETVQLEATILPEDTTDKSLSWNSSDPNVATVSDNGLVKAISAGTVIITATCGEVSATCEIIVLNDAGVDSLLANPESDISVYSTDGILIKKDCKVEDLKNLNKGIYIIVSGKDRYKLSI